MAADDFKYKHSMVDAYVDGVFLERYTVPNDKLLTMTDKLTSSPTFVNMLRIVTTENLYNGVLPGTKDVPFGVDRANVRILRHNKTTNDWEELGSIEFADALGIDTGLKDPAIIETIKQEQRKYVASHGTPAPQRLLQSVPKPPSVD